MARGDTHGFATRSVLSRAPSEPGAFIQAKVLGSQVYDIVAEPTAGL